MKKYISNSSLFFIFLIICLIFWKWLIPGYFFSGDTGFFSFDKVSSVFNHYFWKSGDSFGYITQAPPRLPLDIFINIFSSFNFHFNGLILKLFFFYPYILLSLFGIYFLLRMFNCDKFLSILMGGIYITSTSFIAFWSMGHAHLMVPIALLPWLFYCWIKFIQTGYYFYISYVLFILFLSGIYDIRIALISFLLLFLYSIFYTIISLDKIIGNRRIFYAFPLIFVLFLFANAYWILPTFFSKEFFDESVIIRDTFGGQFWNILNGITNFHSYWSVDGITIFKKNIPSMPFFLFSIVIFLFFFHVNSIKEKKYLLPWMMILVIFIFLVKQDSMPFVGSFSWLAENVPGFSMYREGAKFFPGLSIAYVVIIGLLLNRCLCICSKKNIRKIIYFSLFCFIVYSAQPVWFSNNNSIFSPSKIDKDYEGINFYLKNKSNYDGFFRVIWVPISSNFSFSDNSMPGVNLYSAFSFWSKKLDTTEINDEEFLYSKNFSSLLDKSSVRYVVLLKEKSSERDEELFKWYKDRGNYSYNLEKNPSLQKIIGEGVPINMDLYENRDFRPHIYKTKEKETIYREVPYENIEHIFKNPTEHEIVLKNVFEPLWVNFSESYHPDWKVRVGDFHWWKIFGNESYFLEDVYHEENDAKLNSFSLDPQSICKKYECVSNADGSFDMRMTLYFRPQSYFYLGGIISGITLIGCFGYLGWYGIQKLILRRRLNDAAKEKI